MSSRTESILVVEKTTPHERLDTFLRAQFPTLSRSAIQRVIQQGDVRVAGKPVKASHLPRAGEKIEIHWPDAKPATAQPQEMPLDVLFEDDDLLVLNKPPGMVVHPSAGHEESTLVNALLHHCGGSLSGIGGVARPGIVHRLDKDTSGLLVVAKTDVAHEGLAKQFAAHSIDRRCLAIVSGVPEASEVTAGAPLARSA